MKNKLNKILDKLKLKRKNNKVFYSKVDNFSIGLKEILIISKFINKRQKIFRICLHKNNLQKIHEMIIVHLKSQTIGPLKQKKKFISYHLLKGKLKIELLNKKRSKIFKLDEKNKKHLRIKCDLFRKVISLKPMTIFLEICEGPFKDKDTIWK